MNETPPELPNWRRSSGFQPKILNFSESPKSCYSRPCMPNQHDNECCDHQRPSSLRVELAELVVLGLPIPAHCFLGPGIVNSFVQLCSEKLSLDLHPQNITFGYYRPKIPGSRSIAWLKLDVALVRAIMRLKEMLPAGISIMKPVSRLSLILGWHTRHMGLTPPKSLDYTPGSYRPEVSKAVPPTNVVGTSGQGGSCSRTTFENLQVRFLAFRAREEAEKNERRVDNPLFSPDVNAAPAVPSVQVTAVVNSPEPVKFMPTPFSAQVSNEFDAFIDGIVNDSYDTGNMDDVASLTQRETLPVLDGAALQDNTTPSGMIVAPSTSESESDDEECGGVANAEGSMRGGDDGQSSSEEEDLGNDEGCIEIVLETWDRKGRAVHWATYLDYIDREGAYIPYKLLEASQRLVRQWRIFKKGLLEKGETAFWQHQAEQVNIIYRNPEQNDLKPEIRKQLTEVVVKYRNAVKNTAPVAASGRVDGGVQPVPLRRSQRLAGKNE